MVKNDVLWGYIEAVFFTGLYTWYLGHNLVGLGVALHVRFGRCWLRHLSGDCEAIGRSKEPSNPRSWMGTGGCAKPANLPANLPPNNVCDGLGGYPEESNALSMANLIISRNMTISGPADRVIVRGSAVEDWWTMQMLQVARRMCRYWWMVGGWLVDGWWMVGGPTSPKDWGMRGQSSKPRGRPVSPLHRLFQTRKL